MYASSEAVEEAQKKLDEAKKVLETVSGEYAKLLDEIEALAKDIEDKNADLGSLKEVYNTTNNIKTMFDQIKAGGVFDESVEGDAQLLELVKAFYDETIKLDIAIEQKEYANAVVIQTRKAYNQAKGELADLQEQLKALEKELEDSVIPWIPLEPSKPNTDGSGNGNGSGSGNTGSGNTGSGNTGLGNTGNTGNSDAGNKGNSSDVEVTVAPDTGVADYTIAYMMSLAGSSAVIGKLFRRRKTQ